MKSNHVELEIVWKMTCRRLEKRMPDEEFHKWIDFFAPEGIAGNKIVIGYRGDKSLEVFWESYAEIFVESLSWASGKEMEVEFLVKKKKQQQREKKINKRREGRNELAEKLKKNRGIISKYMKRGIVCVISFLCIGLIANAVNNRNFKNTFYQVGNSKIDEHVRIIQISDLYNSKFGTDNKKLVERVKALGADIIAITGDMTAESEKSARDIVRLCEQLCDVADVYYIDGDHELRSKSQIPTEFHAMLEKQGVTVLQDCAVSVDAGKNKIDIWGGAIQDSESGDGTLKEAYQKFLSVNDENFKLALLPDSSIDIKNGVQYGDLILTGNTAEGIMAVPHFGVFYKDKDGWLSGASNSHLAGKYEINGTPLIISSGLFKKGFVRINDKPELVVVDVTRY